MAFKNVISTTEEEFFFSFFKTKTTLPGALILLSESSQTFKRLFFEINDIKKIKYTYYVTTRQEIWYNNLLQEMYTFISKQKLWIIVSLFVILKAKHLKKIIPLFIDALKFIPRITNRKDCLKYNKNNSSPFLNIANCFKNFVFSQ